MLQFFSKSEKMQETNKHMLMLGRTKLVTNDFFSNFSIKALILFAEIFVYKTSDGGGRGKRGKKCVCAVCVKFTLDGRRFGNTEQGVACDVPLTLP